ncbi:HNH endonuclease [Bradyrhizobium sp. B097]|uniref:HNH endonuclease signature motif containing protein n=1 Tax=Bradyrhizobium sp. B097 TaxID=3140244 RepID=UPI0031840974
MTTLPAAKKPSELVVRSANVPKLSDYREYKPYLRRDFLHSCAYCTMSEAEALAIRFTIDHYEPQRARSDLVNDYGNLMYCCNECNIRKGDRTPPADARAKGIKFFRPDTDFFEDHFTLNGIRLDPASPAGDYSIHALDLNRAMLRKLRDLRQREKLAREAVAAGVRALRGVSIDRLPKSIRGRAAVAMAQAEKAASDLAREIEDLLCEHAGSPLIDLPEEPDEQKARTQRLKDLQAMIPGAWRARDA